MIRRRQTKRSNVEPVQLLSEASENSVVAEAYRMLRTNILLQLDTGEDRGLGALVVTSAGQSEGKSLTCANLALIFAKTGRRVALLDADMRLPSQRRMFNIPISDDGIVELGAKSTKVAEGVDLFDTGGNPHPSPSEALGDTSFAELVDRLIRDYDLVLIDTPPVRLVTDAIIAAQRARNVLFVVGYHQTSRRFTKRAVEMLESSGATIVGGVMNRTPLRGSASASTYYSQSHYVTSGALPRA